MRVKLFCVLYYWYRMHVPTKKIWQTQGISNNLPGTNFVSRSCHLVKTEKRNWGNGEHTEGKRKSERIKHVKRTSSFTSRLEHGKTRTIILARSERNPFFTGKHIKSICVWILLIKNNIIIIFNYWIQTGRYIFDSLLKETGICPRNIL